MWRSAATALPAILFLHYWGGSLRTWNKVIDNLEPSFRCIAYDSRGWGESDSPKTRYSIPDLADDAASLVKSLGLKRFVLVGHSMRGKVAQLLAARQPEGLLGLILVAPATPTPTRFPEEMRQQQIHAYDNRDSVLQTVKFLTACPPASDILEQIVEDSLRGSPEAKKAWPTSGIVEDISGEVPKISVPALIVAGELDRLDSVEQHRREVLPRIRNARMEVLGGSGHLIPIDAPEQLASAIARFVTELPIYRDVARRTA